MGGFLNDGASLRIPHLCKVCGKMELMAIDRNPVLMAPFQLNTDRQLQIWANNPFVATSEVCFGRCNQNP